MERTVKPRDDRNAPFEDDDVEFDPTMPMATENPWYQTDERTRRLATLVGAGYHYVTIEIAYASAMQPELRQVATWEGFDQQPQFPVFRAWLAQWESSENAQVLDLRATAVELVCEQEIALNPRILFVH